MLDPRIEAAARAMAKYRLSTHSFSRSLGRELVDDLQRVAEDRVWPTLVEEARVALDAADGVADKQGPGTSGEPGHSEASIVPAPARDGLSE
jgi:hypothetical protein